MKDEFNDIVKPTESTNVQPDEFSSIDEFNEASEYSDLKTNQNANTKQKENIIDKINSIIKALSITAATGAVAVIASIFILGIDFTGARPDVDFVDVGASEGMVYYNINIGETDT